MNHLHQKLTQKYPSYHNWHQTKHHNKIHWGILVSFALLLSVLILNSNKQIIAQTHTAPPPSEIQLKYLQGEHPRIFIKRGASEGLRVGLDEMVAKVRPGGSLETLYNQMKNSVRSTNREAPNFLPLHAPNIGLVYLLEREMGDTSEANEFLGYARTVINMPDLDREVKFESSSPDEYVILYDWVYDGLTNVERDNLRSHLLAMINLNMSYRKHYHLNDGRRLAWDTLMRAVAIWNEGNLADNLAIQQKLNAVETYYRNDFIPWFNLSGGMNPDSEYYDLEDQHEGVWAYLVELWDETTGENSWNTMPVMKNILTYYVMARKANNMTIHYADQHLPTEWMTMKMSAALFEYRNDDGIGHYITNRMLDQTSTFRSAWAREIMGWERIIWHSPSKPEFDRSTFPLAKWFVGNNPKHDFGVVLLRDKWSTTDKTFSGDTIIFFRSGDYFTGRNNFNMNHFGIYKYGDLAIKDGADEWIGGRIDSHYTAYGPSSVSANTITVSDPTVMLDEGQEYIINSDSRSNGGISHTLGALPVNVQGAYTTPSDHTDNSWVDMGDIAHFETTQDYDYVVGDASNAYRFGGGNNPGTDLQQLRLDVFQRELAFLNKKYLVVFDRVRSINPNFIKRWYLHTVLEPEMSGSQIDYQAAWNRPYGLDTMGGATEWTGKDMSVRSSTSGWTTPGQGKLFLKMLLPSDGIFRKRGGSSNPNAQVNDANFFEFSSWRHNQNHDYTGPLEGGLKIRDYPFYEGRGRWRIEEETWGRTYDNFLNVLYPTESSTASMPNTTVVQVLSNNMAGTLIEDSQTPVLALFSTEPQGGTVSQVSYEANYSSTLTGEHFLANISPGTYDVYKNGVRILTGISPSSKGILSFVSQGGSTFSVSATTFKPSDLNQDTKVDQLDLDILKQNWNRTDKPPSDLNQDGIVDSRDLGIMMSEWSK